MNTPLSQTRFDSNRAWQDALALIKANRDLLLALAGAFVVLPAFAIAVLLPQPEPAKGVDAMAFVATLGEYYRKNALILVAAGLIHTAGTLAMFALFTDASRPTVGQAIQQGFARMPTVIFAQIILGAAVGAMLLVPVLLGEITKAPALTFLGVTAGIGLGVWAMVRLSLLPAAVVVEKLGNPLQAIRRSWALSEGNAFRLLIFFALILIAFLVSTMVASGLVNALLTLVVGGEAAMLGATLMATCVQAAMTVCFTAVFAASYRQLAGAPAEPVGNTFS